jgi:hypothetical protein
MGANSYTVTYNFSSQERVASAWASLCEEDAYESGSGTYAGNSTTMGKNVVFRNHLFSSEEEACRWVLDNHRKWDNPYACSFYIPKTSGERGKSRVKRAKERLLVKQTKKYDFMLQSLNSFRNRKAALVGCKCCGSKLSLEYISKELKDGSRPSSTPYSWITYPTLPLCAVCRKPLFYPSTMERIKKLTLSVEEAEKALKEAQKPTPSKDIGWVVGGWAAC